jgi:flagellar biosynthetic protein FliR
MGLPVQLLSPLPFLLVTARVGGFFAFVPLPGGKAGPDTVRVMLTLGFTLALFPQWPAVQAPLSLSWLTAALLSEAALGVAVGLAVACLTESLVMMAQVVGLQAGYGYASTIDPNTQADAGVLLVVAELIGGLLFFALGLDREILRVFARSLESQPAGAFLVTRPAAAAVVRLTASIFATGLRLALPVAALLALVDVALALAGRLHAQLPLVTLAFPVKMLLALGLLAALAPLIPRIYAEGARHVIEAAAHLAAGR